MDAKMFHEDMTYADAQKLLFTSIREDMSREEISRIKAEYAAVVPILMEREYVSNPVGRLTSHPI